MPWIAIDGGVNAATAEACAAAGANMLIAGTAVFGAGEGAGREVVHNDVDSPLVGSSARLRAAVTRLETLGTRAQERAGPSV